LEEEYDEVEQIEQEHMMMVKEVEALMEQHVSDDVMEKMVLMEKEHRLMMILYRMVVVVAVVENYRFHCYLSLIMVVV
jgi:hypothetical protein